MGPSRAAEFSKIQGEFERCKSHLESSHLARDELTARVDQLSAELRKARMFAAAEEYYIDRYDRAVGVVGSV